VFCRGAMSLVPLHGDQAWQRQPLASHSPARRRGPVPCWPKLFCFFPRRRPRRGGRGQGRVDPSSEFDRSAQFRFYLSNMGPSLRLMKTPYLAHCKLTLTALRPALCSASLRHLHKSPHGVPRAILVLPQPSDRRDARAVVDGHRSTHRVWVVAALRLPPGQKQLSSSSSAAAASRTAQSLETAARAVGRLQVDTVAVDGPTPNARSRPAPTSQPLSSHNLAAVGVLAEGALGGR
jgi:hypothetical protein